MQKARQTERRQYNPAYQYEDSLSLCLPFPVYPRAFAPRRPAAGQEELVLQPVRRAPGPGEGSRMQEGVVRSPVCHRGQSFVV